VRLGLAQIAARRGEIATAREHIESELEQTGRSPGVDLELARLLLETNQPDRAAGLLSLGLDATPRAFENPGQRAAAMRYRSVAWMTTGRVREGIRECRRSLRIEPDDGRAMLCLCLAHLELGEVRLAGYWLHRASRLDADRNHLRRLRERLWRKRLEQVLARARRAFRGG
jgi:tetratricopeptide (TPR) repeat protein